MKIVSKQARAMRRRWKQSLSPGLERTARVNTFPGGGDDSGGGGADLGDGEVSGGVNWCLIMVKAVAMMVHGSYQRDPGCQILRRQHHQSRTFADLSSSASG